MSSYLINGRYVNCSGCGACVQSCPRNCISFVELNDGFMYPAIDKDKCINCNRCLQVCPYENSPERKQVIKSYAAKTANIHDYQNCTSGGVFAYLARLILQGGGLVVACAMTDDGKKCTHLIIDNENDLTKVLGSKYIQSRCDEVFPIIKENLLKGIQVLFCGTPCQVAGLKKYLGHENENLILVDFACHGVPSNRDYQQLIKYLEDKYKGKVYSVKFRDKTQAGWKHALSFTICRNGKTYDYTLAPHRIPYYFFFLHSRNIRESCYQCPYVGMNRLGDLTLADFWGAEEVLPISEIKNGISAVLCNSVKGEKLIEFNDKNIIKWDVSIEKLIKRNQPFQKNCMTYSKHDELLTLIRTTGYSRIKKYYSKKERLIEWIKALIPNDLKRYVRGRVTKGK